MKPKIYIETSVMGLTVMAKDEIILEVRAVREAYARRFNFDVWKLYRDAKKREEKSDRKVVSLKPKRIDPAKA